VIGAAFLACAGALVAACGSSASPSAAPTAPATSTPPATASTPTPTATPSPAVPSCATSALHASIGQGSGTAGSTIYPIVFTNISGTVCTMYGYPGVSFVTSQGGSQIGQAATEDNAFARTLVTLAPGATAHAPLQVVDAQNYSAAKCSPVTAHWLKVYPPGQFDALYISFSSLTCSAKSVHILSVETVQRGSGGQ
jgi:hypothetical protein